VAVGVLVGVAVGEDVQVTATQITHGDGVGEVGPAVAVLVAVGGIHGVVIVGTTLAVCDSPGVVAAHRQTINTTRGIFPVGLSHVALL
jgi:hypothetical protein